MSSSNQTTGLSPSNFTLIFDASLDKYEKLTTHNLRTHSFAAELGACDSPDTVLEVFQRQTQAFSKPRKDEELMKWLKPTVHVLFSMSATLGAGIGLSFPPANVIFTGIGVLLGAVKGAIASYDVLINVFERIQLFLQRLNGYNNIPLTHYIVELLGETMAQVLSVLALSTTAMKDGLIKKSLKRMVGTAEIEDALQRLDNLTKQEGLMTTARNLEVTHWWNFYLRHPERGLFRYSLTYDVSSFVNRSFSTTFQSMRAHALLLCSLTCFTFMFRYCTL